MNPPTFFMAINMADTYQLRESKKKTKKYDLIDPDGKIISFGAKGMSDYTIHHDKARKNRYIARHEANEKQFWDDKAPLTPSYLSRFILWENKDLNKAILNVEHKRGIHINKEF
jgi:hypothetical protein